MLGVAAGFGQRDLVRAESALDRKPVDLFRPGPAFRGAQHDHRPRRSSGGAVCSAASVMLDRRDVIQHVVEGGSQLLMDRSGIVADDEMRFVAVAALMRGYGYEPHFVVGDDPAAVHQQLAATLDDVLDDIAAIQHDARSTADRSPARPAWPMIVLRTPKGWTGPKEVDGLPVEGTFRAHQVPLSETRSNAEHRALLEQWMLSYRPDELFDESGCLVPQLQALAPQGTRRMSANPHANGG